MVNSYDLTSNSGYLEIRESKIFRVSLGSFFAELSAGREVRGMGVIERGGFFGTLLEDVRVYICMESRVNKES